jgi:uncharacterized protein Yka (UPF0111/DUF47 family)
MWIDRAVRWLLPREEHFFDMLDRGAAHARESGELLARCCTAGSHAEREGLVEQMRRVEHDADTAIGDVYEALNKTFVTPIDRSDLYALASALESITDVAFSTSLQLIVHAIDELPEGSAELGQLIHRSTEEIVAAVGELRGLKNWRAIREACDRLDRLESDGDRVYRAQIAAMFRTEVDAIRLIKDKEFLEGLERTLDSCDDVGSALRAVVIKNA